MFIIETLGSRVFQYYWWRKPPTYYKSQTNLILWSCIIYTSPLQRSSGDIILSNPNQKVMSLTSAFCDNYTPAPRRGYTVLPLSVLPFVQDIFHRIFLSNCWWQKSDIWSQASYRYPISWEAFLDPSDSYFLCRLCWILYTLNIYAHFSSHFSQQLLMAEIWYLVTSFI